MKKQDIFPMLQLYLGPVLVTLLGLLLLVSPDTASVLISRILGGMLTLAAIVTGLVAFFGERRKIGRLILAAGLFSCGSLLAARPLLLAAFAGRLVGLVLLLSGLGDIFQSRRHGIRFRMPLLVTFLGAILLLMPMTASRLVFSLCGLAVAVTGIFMLLDRLRRGRISDGWDDPSIIDAL